MHRSIQRNRGKNTESDTNGKWQGGNYKLREKERQLHERNDKEVDRGTEALMLRGRQTDRYSDRKR